MSTPDNVWIDAKELAALRARVAELEKALIEARRLLTELLKIAAFYAPGDDNVAACSFDEAREFLGGDDVES